MHWSGGSAIWNYYKTCATAFWCLAHTYTYTPPSSWQVGPSFHIGSGQACVLGVCAYPQWYHLQYGVTTFGVSYPQSTDLGGISDPEYLSNECNTSYASWCLLPNAAIIDGWNSYFDNTYGVGGGVYDSTQPVGTIAGLGATGQASCGSPVYGAGVDFKWYGTTNIEHDGQTLWTNVNNCSYAQDLSSLTSSFGTLLADGKSTSTITAALPISEPNIQVYFMTTMGTLSSNTCVTGSTGSCSVKISSASIGTASISAEPCQIGNCPSVQTTVSFTNTPLAPFADDFNYDSISAMKASGWTDCAGAPSSQYTVGNSILTLQNNGQTGAAMCWSTGLPGTTDWTANELAEATGGSGSVQLSVSTAHHTYRCDADYYYNSYLLLRDNVIVKQVQGYNSQLNVWHRIRLDMRANVANCYFDTVQVGPYTEPDSGTTLSSLAMTGSYTTTDAFDYVGAASTDFPFQDDFSYTTLNGMLGAGWTQCGGTAPASQYNIGNSVLTLQNDGSTGASMCWNNVAPGSSSWSATAKVEWSGGSYGSMQVLVTTNNHTYSFDADGYYKQYLLVRDGVKVVQGPAYTPQLSVWHIMQLSMQNNVLTMTFDGSQVGTYTEPNSGTTLTSLRAQANWEATDSFDYITATSP
jgi:hypothetical protein